MVTKKEIEAELKDSESFDMGDLRDVLLRLEEFESWLKVQELKVWQPHWRHDDPFIDRLTRAGVDQETVNEVRRRLAVLSDTLEGEPALPDLQKQFDDRDAARKSALQQLAKLLSRRK